MEVLLSIYEDSLSKDINHSKSFESISNNNNNILIIGNSLTRKGVDHQLFESYINDEIITEGGVGYVYPDDTSIIEWYYIFYRYFSQSKIYPKQLYIIFARNQLATAKIEFEEIQRISNYNQFHSLMNVIVEEELSLPQSIDLYLTKIFRIYAYRERIKKRILDIIPNYRITIRKFNSKSVAKIKPEKNKNNYYHLNKIIQLIEELSIKTTFCAIPLPKSYKLDGELIKIIDSSYYCELANFQNSFDFTNNEFIDGYHLNQNGSQKFTNILAEYISSKN